MSNIKLDDYYEDAYPEHNRTTCSDENPCNAEVTGHGCLRCNAIFFTKANAMKVRIFALEESAWEDVENSFKNGIGIGVCLANPNASDEFITNCQDVAWRETKEALSK